jgi:hypothetical protein
MIALGEQLCENVNARFRDNLLNGKIFYSLRRHSR